MSVQTVAAPLSAGRLAIPATLWRGLRATLAAERPRWILWVPVLIGIGIGIYFALPFEPTPWAGAAAAAAGILLAIAARTHARDHWPQAQPIALAAVAITLGFAAAQGKALLVAPVSLAQRVGPVIIEGRVDAAESFPDGQRLTLDRLSIEGLAAPDVPQRVRLRLRGSQPVIRPGDRITLRAMLMPPPAPAVPGGYDFQRQAFFEGLGGVGYSLGSARVLELGQDQGSISLWFARLRFTVGERVRAIESGATGAVMIALLTGEQRAIPEAEMAAIRDSGLAHLLSISGLHIGLVAGIVFVAVRSGLALVPWLALRYPIKKWAAVLSVLAAGAYTLLAAAPVPSQRSFLMVAIVLLAVLVDRQGISMRLIAFAALVILLTQPEAMLGPSFQMSFAAVTALIATYEELRERRHHRPDSAQRTLLRRGLIYLGGVMLSTLIAGSATAPFAAYHFNRFQVYGVVANMIAVPVTGFWIMPCALLSALLMPFGLESLALVPMAWGVELVLRVAVIVASFPSAVFLLPPMPTWGLCLIALGGLWLCLWRQPWRWLGIAAIAAGLAGMAASRVPDLLVDGSARLMAVRSSDGGLLMSSRTAARATRAAWLRRAGAEEPAGFWPAAGAADGAPLRCDSVGCVLVAGGRTVAIGAHGEALLEDCQRAEVVVSLVPVRTPCPAASVVIDRLDLWRSGTHAVWVDPAAIRVASVRGLRGNRPWVIAPERAVANARARGMRKAGNPAPGPGQPEARVPREDAMASPAADAGRNPRQPRPGEAGDARTDYSEDAEDAAADADPETE